jgi:hypothetical protein
MGYIPTMPYARIVPAVILGLLFPLSCLGQPLAPAQGPAPAAPAPVPEGPTIAENILDASTIKVRLMTQIAASIDQKVDMLNQQFKLEGKYYKDFSKPNDFKVRLQLQLVGLGDTGSTMLQVSDGKVLWDFQKVLKMQIYRKKEILPIMTKLNNSGLDIFFQSLVISNLGFGGPEAMMTGLRKAVRFTENSEEKLDGVDVYVLTGTWVDRSKLVGPNDRPLPPNAPLPPYVPSTVKIYIGKENGWPYKIVMVGKNATEVPQDTRATDPVTGRPVGIKKAPPKVDPTDITLLYKLLPLTELKPGLFVFEPPADVPASSVKDETEEFLAQLDLLIQSETARKKAEAAKGADEAIPNVKPIQVGPPQPDAGGVDSFPTPPKTSPK